eukprot:TRINITY_DN938_c0_g1_i4.p1 TRINITY_DN938_c0_g1~~TRINITY_DN938_c0_g1_i4.p1  ORF type:complete len:106 (+),score=16.19 TRINITY_DN938_c0_g1_i4:138-455(+)
MRATFALLICIILGYVVVSYSSEIEDPFLYLVNIKDPHGHDFTEYIQPNSYAKFLKVVIQADKGYPIGSQLLYFNGTILQDLDRIKDVGIRDGSIIILDLLEAKK